MLFEPPVCCKISKKIKGTLWRQQFFESLTAKKNLKQLFSLIKKFLAEAGTQTRDRSVPAKPINLY